MTTDRLLTILGLIIGLPAFFALFFSSEHRLEAALCVTMVFLVLGFAWYFRWQEDRPQFTSLELRKLFQITAMDGSLASYQRVEKMRANFQGISEWWNRGLMQDGTISNLLIDANPPSEIQNNAGSTDICKRFLRPLERGEEVTISLTFNLSNSFMKSRESVVHINSSNVGEIILTVELPRPCIKAELRRTYSGDHGKLIDGLKINSGNRLLEAKIKKPRMGASYHIEWDW